MGRAKTAVQSAVRMQPAPGRRPVDRTPYLFLAPGILLLVALLVVPLLDASALSLQVKGGGWGLGNYVRALTKDPLVWRTMGHTFVFAAVSTAVQYAAGLGISLLINQKLPGQGAWRVLFLVPWMVPAVVPGVVWRWMLDGQFGIFNRLLKDVGLISQYVAWLGQPQTALWGVMIANIWRGFPFMMVMVLAALQAVSHDLYEAAGIDGANAWQQFRHITLPGIKGASLVVLLLGWIGSFMNFGLVQVMTDGGPSYSSEVFSTLVYKNAFGWFDLPYAAALGMILLVLMMLPGLAYIRTQLKAQ